MFAKKKPRSAIEGGLRLTVPRWYWALLLLRLALVFAPQNGYIHPDEFFQSTEPIAGDVLGVDVVRCWELNVTFPLRSMALVQITVGLPLRLLRGLDSLSMEYLDIGLRTTYLLLVIPRLFYFLLSLLNDFCLLKICLIYGQNVRTRLTVFASSYVMLIYSTRTFSNSLEMTLFSVLLLTVSDCMLTSDRVIYHNEFLRDKYEKAKTVVERVNYYKLRNTLPEYSLSKCLQIASVTVVGVFNRPTFIGYAFPSVFFWLVRGLGTKYVGFKDFHARLLTFLLCCIPSILLLIILDSAYYGYLTMAEVQSLEVSMDSFVVTPLNFLKYNLLSANLAAHGLHPRWLHALVNVPLLFSSLGVAGLLAVTRIAYRLCMGSYHSLPRVRSISGLMTFSFVTPLALLSVFPHQEPRFLLPALLPLAFLYTAALQTTDADTSRLTSLKRVAFATWCLTNVILAVFYGFLHQGGVYYVAKHFRTELDVKPRTTNVHLVTSYIYNVPLHLLHTESTDMLRTDRATGRKYRLAKQMFLHELGSESLDNVLRRVKAIWTVNEATLRNKPQDFRLYLVLPSSLKAQLGDAWFRANATTLMLHEDLTFYPHVSVEALPSFPMPGERSCLPEPPPPQGEVSWSPALSLSRRTLCFFQQFSLTLYRVDVSKYLTINSVKKQYGTEYE